MKWKQVALVVVPTAALAIGLPVGLGITGGHQHHSGTASGPVRHLRARPARLGGPGRRSGILVPSTGAYLGAYVQPSQYTPLAEIAAVRTFQHQVHSPLNLIHTYHPWADPFPSLADRSFVAIGKVLLLTWGGYPDTTRIIAGNYDQLIRARAEAVKALGRPILMEFRHEMDRPNVQWAVHGPQNYIKAWDHIRTIFTQVGATNVGWVWCPTGYGFSVGRAQAFYPGNAEVDWVCADVYGFTPSQSLREAAQPFLNWAAHTGKPIIIGEFATGGPPSAWAAWLTAAGQFARTHPQIKAMAYFDADGTDSNGNPFAYWLGGHEQAIESFARLVASRYFRPTGPLPSAPSPGQPQRGS